MRLLSVLLILTSILSVSRNALARNSAASDCVSFAEAARHVGTSGCVTGKVISVAEGADGVTFLNFCAEPKGCPFTVVVLPADLKKVGDIYQLEGRQVEIKGSIQDYNGQTEIVLRRTQQLRGESAFLVVPAVPPDYDVERRGRYSVGRYSHPKAKKPSHKKQGAPISIEDSDESQ
jgi:DNA/RNA endonuclease YhcR with UshA esterase domain